MGDNDEAQKASFEAAARPLIQWLAENRHPHTKVIVDSTQAEVLEGCLSVGTTEYLKD